MAIRKLALGLVAALLAAAGGVVEPGSSVRRQVPPAVCAGCIAPTFFAVGRGWGHGVGMSQYGAYGFAREGYGYEDILAHYYQGTVLAEAPVKQMRVRLVEGRGALSVGSRAPFRVRDGVGQVHELGTGTQRFGPGLSLRRRGDAQRTQLQGPLVFLPGTAPLELERPYRGTLRIDVSSGRLSATNYVGLEQYLYGVVPAEMPHTWPLEALKAQAVAARSYALATRIGGEFDVRDDIRSQVYLGIREEEEPSNQAIDETAGQVLTYGGRIAHTYFFSTSGGRTATVGDVWPSSEPIPYLVSVEDPFDTLSPYHRWGPMRLASPAKLRKKLKVPGRLVDLRTVLNGSGRVNSLVAVGTAGEVSVSGGVARRELALRSTWFRIGVLALAAPKRPAVYGSGVKLSGLARGLASVTLEQRAGGSPWSPVGPVGRATNGTVSHRVKPTVATQYRLSVRAGKSLPVRVQVAPLVRFRPAVPGALRGFARPVLIGTPAEVQRLQNGIWTTVATASIDANGDFEARFRVTPGTYRARVAPGNGLVPGLTPPLEVVPA